MPDAPEGDIVTTIEQNPLVRVGLLSFTPQKHLYVSITRGSFNCYVAESLQDFATGFGGDVLQFSGTEDFIEYSEEGSDEARPLNNKLVRIEPVGGDENGFLMIGPSKSSLRPYRGSLRLILEGKNILAVNEVPLEDYLRGVVAAEMNPEWPREALTTQAIVSRTFAIFHLGANRNRGYDLADDERDQSYGGIAVETEITTDIVVETNNRIVTYNGSVACVVFHEESSKLTASNLDVWPNSGNIPYLASVNDHETAVDYSRDGQYLDWSNWASFNQLRDAFNLDGKTYVGEYLSSISILDQSENGRVQVIDISGEKNPTISALDLATVLNYRLAPDFLPSNRFTISLEGEGYRFTGSGKGHGVGMSQWGVYQHASMNQDHELIIGHYFPGTEITEIPIGGIDVIHNMAIDTML